MRKPMHRTVRVSTRHRGSSFPPGVERLEDRQLLSLNPVLLAAPPLMAAGSAAGSLDAERANGASRGAAEYASFAPPFVGRDSAVPDMAHGSGDEGEDYANLGHGPSDHSVPYFTEGDHSSERPSAMFVGNGSEHAVMSPPYSSSEYSATYSLPPPPSLVAGHSELVIDVSRYAVSPLGSDVRIEIVVVEPPPPPVYVVAVEPHFVHVDETARNVRYDNHSGPSARAETGGAEYLVYAVANNQPSAAQNGLADAARQAAPSFATAQAAGQGATARDAGPAVGQGEIAASTKAGSDANRPLLALNPESEPRLRGAIGGHVLPSVLPPGNIGPQPNNIDNIHPVAVAAMPSVDDAEDEAVNVSFGGDRAALLGNLTYDLRAVDKAFEELIGEIEGLGGELATWLDNLSLPPWAVVATVAAACGVGGRYLWRSRGQRSTQEESAEESSSWVFTRLHGSADPLGAR